MRKIISFFRSFGVTSLTSRPPFTLDGSARGSHILAPLSVILGVCSIQTAAMADMSKKTQPSQQQQVKVYVVRSVNSDVITSVDVDNRLRLFKEVYGMPIARGAEDAARAVAIQSMTDELLQRQAADRFNVTVSDEGVAFALARMERAQNRPEGSLLKELKRLGIPAATLTDQVRTNLAWMELVRLKYADTTYVTDYEVQNQIKTLQQSAGRPSYLVQEIFLLGPSRTASVSGPGHLPGVENGSQQRESPVDGGSTRAFAEQIMKQLAEGVDFGILAQQFSDSPTAMQGGVVGWVREGELDDVRNEVIRALEPGYMSPPIEANGGLYLIRVHEKKMPEQSLGKVLDYAKMVVPLYFVASDEAKAAKRSELGEKLKAVTSLEAFTALADEIGAKVEVYADKAESTLPPMDKKRLSDLDFQTPSPVYDNQDGFMVYWLQDRTERPMMAGLTSPSEVRDTLFNKKMEAAANAYLQQIRRKALVRDMPTGSSPGAAPAASAG